MPQLTDITTQITEDQKKWLKEQHELAGVSIANQIRMALAIYIQLMNNIGKIDLNKNLPF